MAFGSRPSGRARVNALRDRRVRANIASFWPIALPLFMWSLIGGPANGSTITVDGDLSVWRIGNAVDMAGTLPACLSPPPCPPVIPEPATAAALGSSLLAVLALRVRKRGRKRSQNSS
jgi:hypothetical protein